MYVVGHKNPDTDSVVSAIALAELKKKLGVEATPVIQGELNPETEFVLSKFSVKTPEIMTDAEAKDIFLVDHSDISQTIDGLEKGKLLGIVDHHKLGDLTTSEPIEIWTWPVGCTCTVIKAMYDFHNVEIDAKVAGLMLSAIVSDTVIFKSATCTDKDKEAVKELASIADIENVEEYGMEMFKAKSAIDGVSARDLIMRDYKDFDMSGTKVGVGQLEVVDVTMFDSRIDELMEELKVVKSEGRDTVFLLLTDIMKEGSKMLIVSDDESIVEKAFGVSPEGSIVWLDSVMSRKKQVVPQLEEAYSN